MGVNVLIEYCELFSEGEKELYRLKLSTFAPCGGGSGKEMETCVGQGKERQIGLRGEERVFRKP